MNEKQRTIQQNKALHVYFELIAQRLNDAGLDMRKVLKPEVEIPWTKESVKDFMWRPVQKAQLRKDSTAKLTVEEIDEVYETLNRFLAKQGIHEPFPSIDYIIHNS